MNAPFHVLNWHFGWWLVLGAFVTGAVIGLFFHRDDFLGGYDSFRRRIVRLGHIALAALGMMNVLYAVAVAGRRHAGWAPPRHSASSSAASPCRRSAS